MMKYLIHRISIPISPIPPLPEETWARAETGQIDQFPWTKHESPPETKFRLLYDESRLYLRFDCRERFIHATHTSHQSEVWKDNCVEMFVSPSSDLSIGYFNFEFNCLGAILLAYGPGREGRKSIPFADIQSIQIASTFSEPLDLEAETPTAWFLEAAIPFELFWKHSGVKPPQSGTVWRANFNKCAEEVKEPHWATWAPVRTPQPDFHQSGFFGEVAFDA
jgi:hypothetical protein